MNEAELGHFLARTLADRRLSRSERQALAALVQDAERAQKRRAICREAFALATESVGDPEAPEIFAWLAEVVTTLLPDDQRQKALDVAEAHFSPGEGCVRRIAQLFSQARAQVDICVFTITDDRITAKILDAHQRGIAVRVVTDNEKVDDVGSDIHRLQRAGIPVRVDRTEYHMHHKFAIFDNAVLLTGSYNWTRGAAEGNNENFIVTSERRLIAAFSGAFETLWQKLG